MAKDEYNSVIVNNEQDGFASFEFCKIQNIETSSFSGNKIEIKDEINENATFNNENEDEEKKEERTKEKVKEKYLRDSLTGGSDAASSASSATTSAATASSVAATVGAAIVAVPSIITAVAATVLSTKILLDRTRFNATQTQISYEIALEVDAKDDRIFDVRLSNRLLQYNDSKSIVEGDNAGTFVNLTPDTEYEVTVIGYKVVGDTATVDNHDAFQLIDGDILYETKVSTAPDSPEPPTPMLNSLTIGSLYCYNPQDVVNSNYSLPIDIYMSNASRATSLAIAFDVDDNSQYTIIDAENAYWDGVQSVPTLTTIYDHAVDGWKNVDVSEVFQKIFLDPTGTVIRGYTTVNEGDRVRYTIFAEMDGVYKDLLTDYFTIDFTENTVYGVESSSTYSMTSGGSTNVNIVYSNSYNSLYSICYISLTILESGNTYYIPISNFYPDGTLNISLELADAYEIEPTKMDDPDIGDPIGSGTAANIAYDIIHGARCILNVYYTMFDDTFSHTTNSYVVIFNEAI